MSVISIAILGNTAPAQLVKRIRPITGASISEILDALRSGAPIFEREIFGNDTEEVFGLIRSLLEQLEQANVPLLVKEDEFVISPQILRNIMESSEETDAHLRELDDLGHQ